MHDSSNIWSPRDMNPMPTESSTENDLNMFNFKSPDERTLQGRSGRQSAPLGSAPPAKKGPGS